MTTYAFTASVIRDKSLAKIFFCSIDTRNANREEAWVFQASVRGLSRKVVSERSRKLVHKAYASAIDKLRWNLGMGS